MKLLTVTIPTYNRSDYLKICLDQLCKQVPGYEQDIEIWVSDNASTDKTEEVVRAFIKQGFEINYVKNDKNIGPDANIAQAFHLATSKYVLVLADDDVLIDNALERIMTTLNSDDFGVVFIRAYPYQENFLVEFPKTQGQEQLIYDNLKYFIKKVHYNFTFISSNIVNKQLVDKSINVQEFMNTNMVQLSWTFSALFNSKKNAYIGHYLVAAKGGNTGGYQLCNVFGVQVNSVFNWFIARGIKKTYFNIINRRLLFSFFPFFIRSLRRTADNKFQEEDRFRTLYPVFRSYINFWLFTVPSIVLPLPLVSFLLFFIREARKITFFFDKLFAFFIRQNYSLNARTKEQKWG